ncbi:sugar phosphate isomerase/epimerase family protein [Paenibacillus sp. MBLB4367]|uniref:sugar phosphate isomerase/epimerase family protein n=1 Tax=Paenibacillus sp. MBLB4367 TaxID=3384767 RepID=UPI0039082A5A
MNRMGIGVQLYTLREDMAKDFKGTLRKVAELGYEGVEFAGYGGIPAEEMRDLLQSLGLKAIGSHVGLNNLRTNLEQEIAYLKTIGASYLVLPGIPGEERSDEESWKRIFALCGQVGEQAAEHGLVFGYHNHDFEFRTNIDGEYAFDALYSATAPEQVKVEMDIGWVQFAGFEPTDYIRKYSGRLPLVHLKDFRIDAEGKIDTVELGHGTIKLTDVIAAASEAGSEWLIVEQDRCANPPLESIETSINWLKTNYLSQF